MILILLDVDGTLTHPRQIILDDMISFLQNINKETCHLGIVGGSNIKKIQEQLQLPQFELFNYIFAENGLDCYTYNKDLMKLTNTFNYSIIEELGEETIEYIVNMINIELKTLEIPVRTSNFIELRKSIINVSPIGRDCSQEQREDFYHYDSTYKVREKLINKLKKKLGHLNLEYSIGGQISIDIFPTGWNKTYCLHHIDMNKYMKIYFIGDKTSKGGNDYELYSSSYVNGITTTSPTHTMKIIKSITDNI